VIVPDTKNWTWVLDRPCPECAFDASTRTGPMVPGLVRANAADWKRFGAAGAIHPGRPEPSTWSSLEYACHVRDVFRRFDGRIELMLTHDHPMFPNWDQDTSAVEERYEAQDPTRVVADLSAGAEQIALRLEPLTASDWARPGRRDNGATFTVDTIARYMTHDVVHHIWDIEITATRP